MTAKLPLAAFLSLMLSVPAARACGGFFCTTFPMNQVAENILFVQGEGPSPPTCSSFTAARPPTSPGSFHCPRCPSWP